jgi:hypothetical protein
MVEHFPADVTGDAHDGLVTLATLSQFRDCLVPQVMKSKTLQPSDLCQAPPIRTPAFHGAERVNVAVLASREHEMRRFCAPEALRP